CTRGVVADYFDFW
nr:immunoglobulin heavy chain junction region [Mus musculus]MBK4185312.1 immunoglobulin heavy chain junction region [Mus musculus]